ncbi:RNA-binding protein [Ihubacter sp. rT4E-8]|uniref:YlmH family RNA-binding protein n=1 Tax=Ihubacter sp. rT4E-8 TaxID=3242369 RepID=UPI003CF9E755
MREDDILLGQIEDKIAQCENKYIVTHTGFLDGHQQSVARIFCGKNHIEIFDAEAESAAVNAGRLPACRTRFYGGYDEAERVVLVNLPDYAFLEDENPLTVIRATVASGGRSLTHRDYLGSLVGLGIKRDLLGDILVRPDGADIIVLADIADFLLTHYCKAGRMPLSLEQVPISALMIPEPERKTVTDTVASLRLDSVVASAFGLPRSKAADAIKSGIVFVNHVEALKADRMISEGDQITLRGRGKARLIQVGGRSRKDRVYITIERY